MVYSETYAAAGVYLGYFLQIYALYVLFLGSERAGVRWITWVSRLLRGNRASHARAAYARALS